MIPNFLPIVLGLGVMHWVGLPLDLMSILVGSIALGLAVDDTIHFFHNFQRYLQETGNPEEAVRRTLNTTGRAMLFTSIVLSIGFFSYTISEMNNLFSFGLITGLDDSFCFSSRFVSCSRLDGSAPSKKVEEIKHGNLNHSVILSSNYKKLINIKIKTNKFSILKN